MRARLLHIGFGFVAAFVVLAVADARVQLAQRAFVESHGGDPRFAQSIAARGTLYDAAGVPLAFSKGERRVYSAGSALAQLVGYSSPVYGESGLEAGVDAVVSPRSAETTPVFGPLFRGSAAPRTSAAGSVILTLRSDIAS